MTKTTDLPTGYSILNDGPNREVLTHENWDHGKVFHTVREATVYAKYLENPND